MRHVIWSRRLATVGALGAALALAACQPGIEEAGDPASESAGVAESAGDGQLDSEDDKVLYAAGALLAQNLRDWELTQEELVPLIQGLQDAAAGRELAIPLDEYRPRLQAFAQSRAQKAAEAEKKAAEPFLAEAAAEEGARKTDSGLVYLEKEAGSGASPSASDQVKVHYHGTLIDGSVFDSSVERGEPAVFPLNRVIPCWTEAIQLMKEGGKARIVCPSDIAYGDRGAPPRIKPGAALVFDVELLEVVKADDDGDAGSAGSGEGDSGSAGSDEG